METIEIFGITIEYTDVIDLSRQVRKLDPVRKTLLYLEICEEQERRKRLKHV